MRDAVASTDASAVRPGPARRALAHEPRWAAAEDQSRQAVPVLVGAPQVVDGPRPRRSGLSGGPSPAGAFALVPTQACVGYLGALKFNL